MNINLTLWLIVALSIMGSILLLNRFVFKPQKMFGKELGIVIFSREFFGVIAFVFVLRAFLFEPFQIPSGSMIPTLKIGDFIVVNKFAYGIRVPLLGNVIIPINKPRRGDVMVFIPPGDDRHFIKRVIGLSGDIVEFKNNQVVINGVKMKQQVDEEILHSYGGRKYPTKVFNTQTGQHKHQIQTLDGNYNTLGRTGVYHVPEGHYFLVGDNRDGSADSRSCFGLDYCNQPRDKTPHYNGWSAVPESNVVGKAVYIWMHWDGIFSGNAPSFERNRVIH